MQKNIFLPDFIKNREKQERAPKANLVEKKIEKNEIELRNEEILSNPILTNEHYIDGEQRKLLYFLKEHNFNFDIESDQKIAGKVSYKISWYGSDLLTGRNCKTTARTNGKKYPNIKILAVLKT